MSRAISLKDTILWSIYLSKARGEHLHKAKLIRHLILARAHGIIVEKITSEYPYIKELEKALKDLVKSGDISSFYVKHKGLKTFFHLSQQGEKKIFEVYYSKQEFWEYAQLIDKNITGFKSFETLYRRLEYQGRLKELTDDEQKALKRIVSGERSEEEVNRVKRITKNKRKISKPVSEIPELRDSSINPMEVSYIGSLSFEDRDLAGIRWLLGNDPLSLPLKRGKISLNPFFLVDEDTYSVDVFSHTVELGKLLKPYKVKPEIIICDFHNPKKAVNELIKIDPNVFCRFTYLDPTTFTKALELELLKATEKTPGIGLYFEPMEYASNLSHGLDSVKPLPHFQGKSDKSKEEVLVILVGHETDRASLLVEEIDPGKLVLVIPSSDDTAKHLEWNKKANKVAQQIISSTPLNKKDVSRFFTSSHTYQTVLFDLCKIRETYPAEKYELAIAPLGTKVMNAAVSTFASRNEDIVVYDPIPERYNTEDYTRGFKPNPYLFPLKLESRILCEIGEGL